MRVLVINTCSQCKHCEPSQQGYQCRLSAKHIGDSSQTTAPEWCQLIPAETVGKLRLPPIGTTATPENSIKVPLRRAGGRRVYTGEMVAFVSPVDAGKVAGYHWYVRGEKHGAYAVGRKPRSRQFIQMHRLIIGAQRGQIVDHINSNGLDNRRENLRLCNSLENARNTKPTGHSSQFKGVIKGGPEKWYAQITVAGKRKHIGTFDSQEQAAFAYDQAAIVQFGEFAWLNFPERSISHYRAALFGPQGPLAKL